MRTTSCNGVLPRCGQVLCLSCFLYLLINESFLTQPLDITRMELLQSLFPHPRSSKVEQSNPCHPILPGHSLNLILDVILKGPESSVVVLGGNIPSFVPTSICSLHELAPKLHQGLVSLGKVKLVLDPWNTCDAD